MPVPHAPQLNVRDRGVILAITLLAVLCAAPGVHFFALWLSPLPALVVSHGPAAVGLTIAFWQWRSRRRHTGS